MNVKLFAMCLVLMISLNTVAFGYAEKNSLLYAPQISPITVDGSFGDWSSASAWATFGKWWDPGAEEGNSVTGLASTTRTKYAWSPTANRLYIAVESTEGPSLILEVGGLYGILPYNRDTSITSIQGIKATQIEFSGWAGGIATSVSNQISGTSLSGVQAAYTWDGTTMRIEISMPICANWEDTSSSINLSNSMDVYVYANVFSDGWGAGDSQAADGKYIYFSGRSVVNCGSMVRLRSQAQPFNCDDVPYFGKDLADLNGDCYVDLSDFGLVAVSWLQVTDANDFMGNVVKVDDFGAVGNGVADDTAAFQSAANAIRGHGGAIVLGKNKVYRIGKQLHTDGVYPYWRAQSIINISGVAEVKIIGNGATLKVNDNMRFGSFDKTTGEPYTPTMPFTDYDYRTDIGDIIWIANCDDVEIRDLTIDGNIDNIILGGQWGDTGTQCAATGLNIAGNKKASIKNVYTHHNGLDGVMLGYPGAVAGGPAAPHDLQNVESYYNARQGLSWVGGLGLTVQNSNFSHTGRGRFVSAPAAGLDIEAEEAVNRNGKFINCQFVNNSGCGIVADSGDSADCTFTDCLIWGTTSWSIWPKKPGFKFINCDIYGTVVNTYGSSDASKATQFTNCRFEDVFDEEFPSYYSAALLECWGQNVKFDSCVITANQTRALYIDDVSSQEIFNNCDIYHKNAGLTSGGYQSMLKGSMLSNTRFHEVLSTGNYYISVDNATVDSGLVVDGPRCKWQSTTGLSGTIPSGVY